MELNEANRILRSVKSAIAADGVKLPANVETDGLMMLLDRIDCDKFLANKIKHARTSAPNSSARKRMSVYFAFFRALAAFKSETPDSVTAASLTMLNRSLFGDLCDNAGHVRQNDLTENGSAHTDPKYIPGSIKAILAKMNDLPVSPSIGREDFAGYLTHYMRELIILHPFECGSDFTVRIFIMLFCKIKGFSLQYFKVVPNSIKAAETSAFITDDVAALFKIFVNCLSYAQKTEKRRAAPKTRREINRDAKRELRDGTEVPETDALSEPVERIHGGDVKLVRSDETDTSAPVKDEDKLRRAIKLQQKITRLNEQLAEIMDGGDE